MDSQETQSPVLDALTGRSILSSREIATAAGLPRATVLEILDRLMAEGLVEALPKPEPHQATMYRLAPIKAL